MRVLSDGQFLVRHKLSRSRSRKTSVIHGGNVRGNRSDSQAEHLKGIRLSILVAAFSRTRSKEDFAICVLVNAATKALSNVKPG